MKKRRVLTHKKQTLKFVQRIIAKRGRERVHLLALLHDLQEHYRYIPLEAMQFLADEMELPLLQVESTASFYHFFSSKHRGRYTIYLNTSATSEMAGCLDVRRAFEKEAGISFGQVTPDGKIGLFETSCIGMSDQEPAAIINGIVFPKLNASRVKKIVRDIKRGVQLAPPKFKSQIRRKGPVLFPKHRLGEALQRGMEMGSLEVIERIRSSGLRGRGGAGFPTGQKWAICRSTDSDARYVMCNVDEGEPGTFKDRVLLTEHPRLVFEGMILAGFAIESKKGILYLRYEYQYLKKYLETVLGQMRKEKWLGSRIRGSRFSFDIEIVLGAGAYICGEESALIESAEGKRGEPRNRPPFPVESGYLRKPTIVNNPETYACAVRILEKSPEWFRSFGTQHSSGVKLLSVAGDCAKPGIYEVEWGVSVQEVLDLCEAQDVLAVQVGGPSGTLVAPSQFGRKICYSDLGTGGAFTVFSRGRDLLSILHNHMDFFARESCGFCVPCRAGNTLLLKKLEKIMVGSGTESDLKELRELGGLVKKASRCGLGQTSPNPILTALEGFGGVFLEKVRRDVDFLSQFNMENATVESAKVANRKPYLEREKE